MFAYNPIIRGASLTYNTINIYHRIYHHINQSVNPFALKSNPNPKVFKRHYTSGQTLSPKTRNPLLNLTYILGPNATTMICFLRRGRTNLSAHFTDDQRNLLVSIVGCLTYMQYLPVCEQPRTTHYPPCCLYLGSRHIKFAFTVRYRRVWVSAPPLVPIMMNPDLHIAYLTRALSFVLETHRSSEITRSYSIYINILSFPCFAFWHRVRATDIWWIRLRIDYVCLDVNIILTRVVWMCGRVCVWAWVLVRE